MGVGRVSAIYAPLTLRSERPVSIPIRWASVRNCLCLVTLIRVDDVYTFCHYKRACSLRAIPRDMTMSNAVLERHGAPRETVRRGSTSTINLRIEPDTRDLIDKAASAIGKTRTEFMIESARQHAIDVLLDQRLFVLDPERFDAFAAALDNPRPAGERLKNLMRRRPLWDK